MFVSAGQIKTATLEKGRRLGGHQKHDAQLQRITLDPSSIVVEPPIPMPRHPHQPGHAGPMELRTVMRLALARVL